MKSTLLFGALILFLASCSQEKNSLILISKTNGINRLYKVDQKNGLVPLLEGGQNIANPVLSPNKTKIAFMSEDSGNWNIHTYNILTEAEIHLASGPSIESFPAWSADGTKLAYMANRGSNRDIYIRKLNDGTEKRITTSDEIESQPLWSFSVKDRIYFKSLRNTYEGVFFKTIGGDSITEIAPPGGANEFLRNVPGYPKISFVHHSVNQNNFLVFDEEKGQSYSLLVSQGRMGDYDWTNTANKLAISIGSQIEVYTYSSADGLKLDFVISEAAYPVWSKDDAHLYYSKRIDGILQIFKYDVEEKIESQITYAPADCTDLVAY